MEGPFHDFWLMPEGQHRYEAYHDLLGRRDAPVRLPDNLMHYMYDTWAWIPSINPANRAGWSGSGLNLYGTTVINATGGPQLERVCQAWSALFACGPSNIVLTGRWTQPFDDGVPQPGTYETLMFDRDWFADSLASLADFGARTATGKFFVWHLGI